MCSSDLEDSSDGDHPEVAPASAKKLLGEGVDAIVGAAASGVTRSIIDTITQALLLNPNRTISTQQGLQGTLFDFSDFEEAATAKDKVTRKLDDAAEREKASRSIFAQHAIKAHEVEADLREVDEAIGDPKAVETFVTSVLNNLMGVQVAAQGKGYRVVTGNLPPALREVLPAGDVLVAISTSGHSPNVLRAVQAVLAAQASRAQRLAAADWVIFNDGLSLAELKKEVFGLPLPWPTSDSR